ncbi:hypothetical protein HYQ44_007689 [Verticillium longisporum]|nr:hypothetical protein HYQ44_007689 [Verticillium longisporum]
MASRYPPPPVYKKTSKKPSQQISTASLPVGAAAISGFGFTLPVTVSSASKPQQVEPAAREQPRPSFESADTIDRHKEELQPQAAKKSKWYRLR